MSHETQTMGTHNRKCQTRYKSTSGTVHAILQIQCQQNENNIFIKRFLRKKGSNPPSVLAAARSTRQPTKTEK